MHKKKLSVYSSLKDTWAEPQETFFIAYAVEGPMIDPSQGLQAGLPIDYPLINSPVKEPSPLNTRWEYNPGPVSLSGIL